MRLITLLVGIGLVALMATVMWAQATPRRVALVIANSSYTNASQLANPGNDAKIVAAALRQAGFQVVDAKANLGVADFRKALRDFRTKADGAQVALVYYAGHGIEGSGRNWLIPTDAQLASERDLEDEAINLDRVMEDVRGADLRVVILDACRNNPYGRTWRAGTRAFNRGLGGIDADDVLVIYAAAPGQTASDGTGANSPFAKALAKRLPQADLPIQLLGGMVRDDVLGETSGEQRPFVSASITGTPFYLVPRTVAGVSPGPSQPSVSVPVAAAQATPPASFVDARTTPSTTRAPLITVDPKSLPDFALFRECDGCPEMVVLPAGTFTMGSTDGDADERPTRSVSVKRFAISRFETTNREYEVCVSVGACPVPEWREQGSNYNIQTGSDSHYKKLGDALVSSNNPVVGVSWTNARAYTAFATGRSAGSYRLPSEAEWEYAARAGSPGKYSWGDGDPVCDPQARIGGANFSVCSDDRTRAVGSFRASGWGLFDMHGNVWEWVEDCYADSYAQGQPNDGSAFTKGSCSVRVYRGGSWNYLAQVLRSANRDWNAPEVRSYNLGFRLSRTL